MCFISLCLLIGGLDISGSCRAAVTVTQGLDCGCTCEDSDLALSTAPCSTLYPEPLQRSRPSDAFLRSHSSDQRASFALSGSLRGSSEARVEMGSTFAPCTVTVTIVTSLSLLIGHNFLAENVVFSQLKSECEC